MMQLDYSSVFDSLSTRYHFLTFCCTLDVSYLDSEGSDSVADHKAIPEHILNARCSLKSSLVVPFKEHSIDLVQSLNEACP